MSKLPKLPFKVDLSEADYQFGVGRLKMTVIQILEPLKVDGIDWIEVIGEVPQWGGGHKRRRVAVRLSALNRFKPA